MARRIPLPRLTHRQRSARWQRERRQQAIIVVVFSAILFFVLGLMAWAATDRYYRENLKSAATFDGHAIALREWKREVKYQQTKFYVEFGVPVGLENDPQIAQQKSQYERNALGSVVEYAVLDTAAKSDGVSIPDDAVQARYASEFSQFRSRHILVMPAKDAKDKDAADKAALEKATGIAKQLKEKPNDQDLWNSLAKQSSEDPGSKDSGGELGWVGKGQFVKEFEDAATSMQIGQVSDPVKSQFGYHIIQVEERRGPEASELVQRWLGAGFTLADITAHTRYDLLREEFTKRRQEAAAATSVPQIHVAWIQVSAPIPVGGDFTSFTAQLKKVTDVNAALDKGTDFAEVAKQFSEDSATKDKGGDMGWLARGMLTDLAAEDELFSLDAGARSRQHNTRVDTTWYKVLERSDARPLDDDQKKKVKDNAYSYWLSQQKKAHDVVRLVPGLEFE
jgi:parvulin-like peptidyl-prolyl isomerase